jgi:hypothetical protein
MDCSRVRTSSRSAQYVEVSADQRDVRGAGQGAQMVADRAPGVLDDLERDVRGRALARSFVVDPGAEAAYHPVVDEAVDARVRVGA